MAEAGADAENILSKEEFRQKCVARLVGSDGPTAAGKRLGIPKSTVSSWINEGVFPEPYSLYKAAKGNGALAGFWMFDETPKAQALPKKKRPLILPVHAEPKAADRRSEIPLRFYTVEPTPKGFKVPTWLQLAAGEGIDLELSEDFIYVEELKNRKGVHSAVIRGDSMLNTLFPGDVVLLEEINGGRHPLPHIETAAEKTPLAQWKRDTGIKNDDICVVSINEGAPTIKRIVYDTERGELKWKLQIIADNPPAWRNKRPFQVAVGDTVVFHAKLIGRAEPLKRK